MKKKVLLGLVSVLVVGMMALSFADAAFGPAAIYANLTGVTEEEAYALKLKSGDTFGDLAKAAGVYDAFNAATLAAKEVMLKDMVTAGTITQAQADEVLAALADCDGTQSHILRSTLGFGQHPMNGQGNGQKLMNGQGNGQKLMNGAGQGTGNGQGRWQTSK